MPIHDWKRVNSGLFHHFHQRWIGSICDALNGGVLPQGYFALAEQSAGGSAPDVLMLERHGESSDLGPASGVAVAERPPKTQFVQTLELDSELYARKADRVAIHHSLGDVVALIEIVSPGNKSSVAALRSFIDKAVRFLQEEVHLVIVDLYPPSRRDPKGIHGAILEQMSEQQFALPAEKPLTLVSYCAGVPLTAYVEPCAVGATLVDMPIFVDRDRYVPVPLEATYMQTWRLCPAPFRAAVEVPAAT
jgi:hypothetical protein